MVLSDMGESLSPNHAPETTAPTTIGTGIPMPMATPVSASPIVATEPKLVPVKTAISAQRIKVSGRMIFGETILRPKYIRDGIVPPMIHAPTIMPTISKITMGIRLSLIISHQL